MMMKSRTLFFVTVGLLLLGVAIFIFSTRDQKPAQTFSATINRDCAPWDGSAFTVTVRYDPTTTITISIWQSPDIKIPTTFTFPDDTNQIGTAYILPELDPLQLLSGTVLFRRVIEGNPIEGKFELVTQAGQRFAGQFEARWENTVALCG
jgi:hypothetical protein